MDYIIEPPTERAKQCLGGSKTLDEAIDLAQVLNVPEIEIYEAWHYFKTVTLPVVETKPWAALCRARLEKRIRWLERELIRRTDTYRTLRPFSARKKWHETKIIPCEQLLEKTKKQLDVKPSITWNFSEVMALKQHGVEKYLSYYVDRFYPLQESAV